MNRRQLIQRTGAATAGLLLTQKVMAEDCAPPVLPADQFVPSTGITNNHGHAFEVATSEDVIAMLRDARANGPLTLDIQGQSGHPHAIDLNEEALIEILATGTATVTSSNVAGHTHNVTIDLKPTVGADAQ